MKADRALTVLVYSDAVLTILAIVVDRVLCVFLPGPLRGYLAEEAASPWGAGDIVVFGLWMAVNAATVVAWLGLLNLWRPARAIYFWSWVAALLLIPLESAWILTPVGYTLDTAASLVGGALLGVLYFSDARLCFESPAHDVPEARAARA